jgi:metallo-beta-lactamase class B
MKGLLVTFLFSFIQLSGLSQYQKIKISGDIELIKISDIAYVHVSYTSSPKFGRFPSNGFLLVNNGNAFLFDTPMTDSLTLALLLYLQDSLKLKIKGFVTNDWHEDSMGGLKLIDSLGIPSYSNELTRQIAQSKKLPIPKYGFNDSLSLVLGDKTIKCAFYGAAHTLDNIVVWIPSEKILFADCMVKELKAKNLGFTGDGDLELYPKTLEMVKAKYPDAAIVIPGHGNIGGVELIDHTLDLTKKTETKL